MDRGTETIADADERARLRWQARAVLAQGLIGGVVLTALALLLPG